MGDRSGSGTSTLNRPVGVTLSDSSRRSIMVDMNVKVWRHAWAVTGWPTGAVVALEIGHL